MISYCKPPMYSGQVLGLCCILCICTCNSLIASVECDSKDLILVTCSPTLTAGNSATQRGLSPMETLLDRVPFSAVGPSGNMGKHVSIDFFVVAQPPNEY
ncbi:uncharacterized protein B0T15DRAFT_221683 [Chaetomium strumarium]|uniref:Secreted protein n=1 Tax=Chaetomium strumarium TaxID=1170767 RepID=A0AAJ0GUA5_9PEZI|nr:hypothetical protein B0T15DRAFT_221683 [Chaetomium strumarium]